MKIDSLKLKDYRNYKLLELSFDPHINIFYGDNAQGKTNILEAIYMTGTTKSHRGARDQEMIRFGQEEAHIEAIIRKRERSCRIDIHLKKHKSKGVAVNRVSIHRASELFGIVNFVFFSPEDLNIIKNGPAERRRFLDLELSQLDKFYLNNLANYHRIVNQRNHLMKDIAYQNRSGLEKTLDVWDEQLVRYGNQIINVRKQFISEINEIVSNIHKKLTGNRESVQIIYAPSNGKESLSQLVQKNRERDIRMKNTSFGPHRDDIRFLSGDMDLRRFGSQGQQRTAALSLKLSEIALVEQLIGEKPILLMDDVLSELDRHRQNYLLESIHDIQTFLTCTGVEDFINQHFEMNRLFHVKAGEVIKEDLDTKGSDTGKNSR